MPILLDDQRIRLAAFDWLSKQVEAHGSDVLPRTLLLHGFELDGHRIPLMSQQGIFKPKVVPEIPLSITTTPSGPYDDKVNPSGTIFYKYRGTNPNHPENAGLRNAMLRRTPLIYFFGIVPGRYMAVWPVFIVGDNPASLVFEVSADDLSYADFKNYGDAKIAEGRRAYITVQVQRRMHQQTFRERVLDAYNNQCALCRLRHRELLDAAHIIPDTEPEGEPVVTNGLALCKLHHAAFDGFFLGIRPDYIIEIRRDVLNEEDGPMLTHGLQGLHGIHILIPRKREQQPTVAFLERRYEGFKKLSA